MAELARRQEARAGFMRGAAIASVGVGLGAFTYEIIKAARNSSSLRRNSVSRSELIPGR
jgi:hypothetical protein